MAPTPLALAAARAESRCRPTAVVAATLVAVAVVMGLVPLAVPAGAATGTSRATGSTVIDGPDVASYQHPSGAAINWRKVARAGKDFAIVKATEGTAYRNPWFHRDYFGARQVGMVRGSYHFARPAFPIVATAQRQAKFYVKALGTSPATARTLPPALDLEVTGGLGRADLVTWAQTFLLEVRRLTGRVPMLYTYPYFWSASLGDPVGLARWPLWMASYSGPVNVGATLWQYTSTAHVDGIRGGVDMSRLTADPSMWSALSDGRTATPWPAAAPGAPQAVVAHPGDAQVVVSWLPGDTGSSDVTSYWVTASPGGAHAVVGGTAHQATISGLTNGTAYTFTVVASNKVGAGEASPATAAVTPLVPTRLSVQPSAPLTYGDDVVVSARLLQSDTGRSLAGRTVTASVRALGGGAWTALPDRVTTKHGWVALHLGPAVTSQVVRLSFAGPAGWHSSSTTVDLVAHRKVSGWLSRSRVRVGRAVTLQGRVTPALEGLVVRRQRLEGGVWRTTATTTVDAAGRYSFALVFRRRTTARLRVVVPAKAGLGAGVSPTRTLTAH